MPKNTPPDIMPPERKSIRRIPLSITRASSRPGMRDATEDDDKKNERPAKSSLRKGHSRLPHFNFNVPKFGIIFFALVAILLVVFALATYFAGATVTVTPKSQTATIDVAGLARASGDGLVYRTVSVGGTASETVPSSGQTRVDKKASGKIIVYNNYSAAPQRLIKNTRFATSDGLIYRISTSIVVPGQRLESGKKTPGSVEATVYADLPGSGYNIGLADFTIPGFKGDPRYSAFYARSETPMTGGFSGMMPSADPKQLAGAYSAIEALIAKSLRTKIVAAVPPGFIFFDSAIDTQFLKADPVSAAGNAVSLSETATSTAYVFDVGALSAYLASHAIGDNSGAVIVANFPALTFIADLSGTAASGTLQFDVKGAAQFVWQFDADKFRNDLAGKAKKDMASVLVNYPSIEKAEVVVRPFWRSGFPSNPNKIKIVTANPVFQTAAAQ